MYSVDGAPRHIAGAARQRRESKRLLLTRRDVSGFPASVGNCAACRVLDAGSRPAMDPVRAVPLRICRYDLPSRRVVCTLVFVRRWALPGVMVWAHSAIIRSPSAAFALCGTAQLEATRRAARLTRG